MLWLRAFFGALLITFSTLASAQGFLRADGTRIVDGDGREVILRGMGLGGWMLQEGYMLQLPELGQEHRIRGRIAELVGPERTAQFYRAWLDNHMTKADVDAMAAAGFSSIRLPMHHALLTEDGFRRIDLLIE